MSAVLAAALAVMPGPASLSSALRPFAAVKSAFATPEGERVARERFALIEPLLAFDGQPGRFRDLRLADGSPVRSSTALARYLAERHGIGVATLWRWRKAYAEGGIAALEDRAVSRFFDANPRAAQFVAAKYWDERLSATSCHRALVRDRGKLGILDAPSYETVRSFIQSLPAAPTTLAREGEKAFNERHLPYLSRGYEEETANQIWVSDHMIADVLTWDDCLSGSGQAMRLRLTMVLDFRSRRPVGWTFCGEGSSWSITTAVRNAVLRYGPCRLFYCDNGKDYKKVARAAAPGPWWRQELETVTGLLAQLGIKAQHCLKYHPQSKHVERFFATVHGQFDAKFTAGYTTGDAYKRPEVTRLAARRHGQMLRAGEVEGSPLPPASVYIAAFGRWVEHEYGNQPHSGKGMDGRSPNRVFDEQYPAERRPRIELAQVAHLFYERESRRVDSCGVRLRGARYVAATPEGTAALLMRSGEYLQVAYDKNDRDAAVALDGGGNLVAELRPERLLTQSAEAQPAIAESMAERRRMQRDLKCLIRQTADGVRRAGHLTEREHLEAAAGLETGISILTRRAPNPPAESAAAPHNQNRLQSEDLADMIFARMAERENP